MNCYQQCVFLPWREREREREREKREREERGRREGGGGVVRDRKHEITSPSLATISLAPLYLSSLSALILSTLSPLAFWWREREWGREIITYEWFY
ncbi:hypothetical protein DPMN_035564 [Dreissena polymorpha]|uniref:Uncharacterized protein n=1 Tax=Dreissena polymorpha TaxID=45954 RepID=A0A9D4MAU4_DREPO|nr:hypothetical protein DPMN_035564 [Dreissena polymorpha]